MKIEFEWVLLNADVITTSPVPENEGVTASEIEPTDDGWKDIL